MSAFPAGYRFHDLREIPSTNLYAMERIYAGLAAAGDVFFAQQQLAGKGQRGKSWYSQPGESILMSVVYDMLKLAPSQSFRLSATIALACQEFLQNMVADTVQIKWPNDLYWRDRKAGGILIENALNAGTWKWSVVGIGINVNQQLFPENLPNPVSLQMITGRRHDAAELAKLLCVFLEKRMQDLFAGKWNQILEAYNQALYGRGQVKKLKKDNAIIPCTIRRVNGHGVLLAGESEEWQFEHGEVDWLL